MRDHFSLAVSWDFLKQAEQAERFEDMVKFLKEDIVQKSGEDFTIDERNLLAEVVGFNNWPPRGDYH